MKPNVIIVAITFVFVLFSTNCAHWYNATDPKYPELIKASKPDHKGSSETGTWKAWSYRAYPRSVSLDATTGVMRFHTIDIFDIDSDGVFDTVFAQKDRKWRFGTTRSTRKEYLMIDSGLSNDEVLGFISTANQIKKTLAQIKGPVPKAKVLEKPSPKVPASIPIIKRDDLWHDLYNPKESS